jgi:hypothetical protein
MVAFRLGAFVFKQRMIGGSADAPEMGMGVQQCFGVGVPWLHNGFNSLALLYQSTPVDHPHPVA